MGIVTTEAECTNPFATWLEMIKWNESKKFKKFKNLE